MSVYLYFLIKVETSHKNVFEGNLFDWYLEVEEYVAMEPWIANKNISMNKRLFLPSQNEPLYPGEQIHLNPLSCSIHFAPFLQRSAWQLWRTEKIEKQGYVDLWSLPEL